MPTLTYDDLEGLGLDLQALLNTATTTYGQVKTAKDAKSIAIAQAKAAAAQAVAEQERQRTQAIIAGNAPKGADWTQIGKYAALAVGLSVGAVALLRIVKRRGRR